MLGELEATDGAQLSVPPSPETLVSLPIDARRREIESALRTSRVVVIVGGTGCGKSTRVPQYLLDAAADDAAADAQEDLANVLVTQPRRMAAVTLARHVAAERGQKVGLDVGYRIRGEVVPGRKLSFVTAGYLLSWLTMDPTQFASVTHIILDEAHIRSAEMELLMLQVKMLMRLYPGPRLVLMSATIEAHIFAEYFADIAGPAPPAVAGMLASPTLARQVADGGPLEPPEVAQSPQTASEQAPQTEQEQLVAAAMDMALTQGLQQPEAKPQPQLQQSREQQPRPQEMSPLEPLSRAQAQEVSLAAGDGEVKTLVVGDSRFRVDEYYLDDLAAGQGPAPGELTAPLCESVDKAIAQVFPLEAPQLPVARVWRSLERVAVALIPEVAQAGTTLLVFVPGYADLARLHSKLYWDLPILGSVNMGAMPPKPEALELLSAAEEEELDEMDELGSFGSGAPAAPAAARRPPSRETALRGAGADGAADRTPSGYRLFALHSQVPIGDEELVLQAPEPGVCHIVLATTIAESSITLPEVSGVLDFGVHRMQVCDHEQHGLALLKSQWCSHPALRQRLGRTGRTRPGWCIRMVPRKFYEEQMPRVDEPEILRTPLATLFLKAKGISDGLKRIVSEDDDAKARLGVVAASPLSLLMNLPAPPPRAAIDAAIRELGELGVLSDCTEHAAVSVLGKIALFLPVDVKLCRLIWLGSLWGCAPEAIVLAAACTTPSPFLAPSRLTIGDPGEFAESLRRAVETRAFFDGGHCSEPLMGLRLFCSWARRLSVTTGRVPHYAKWHGATASLCETMAVDPQRMDVFIGMVSDLALRALEMCDDRRGDDACPTREAIHGLVRLLRRPDLTPSEQRELSVSEARPPRLGEVFSASAETLYALLAAAFSHQLLVGGHRYTNPKTLEPMLDALEGLTLRSGVASQDAVLVPQAQDKETRLKMSSAEGAKEVVSTVCGVAPQDVHLGAGHVACDFERDSAETTPGWLQDAQAAQLQGDPMYMGLEAARRPRLRGLAPGPRLCIAAAGGMRTFAVEDLQMLRAVSPYEVSFALVSSSLKDTRRRMNALFHELNPLGCACHITNPEVPLGADDFAGVAGSVFVSGQSNSNTVRVAEATLLAPEQVLYALTTLHAGATDLSLCFVAGAGGSAADARAALSGVQFWKFGRSVAFNRHLPGRVTVDQLNAVRSTILRCLTAESDGGVLLWQDPEAAEALQALVAHVSQARLREVGQDGRRAVQPQARVRFRASDSGGSSSVAPSAEFTAPDVDVDVGDSDSMDVVDFSTISWDIQALAPLDVPARVEEQVAWAEGKKRGRAKHKWECPDCGEHFRSWADCQAHYESTCHLDVSTAEAIQAAKAESRPVRFRCLECDAPFYAWKTCREHLQESGHLDWASWRAQRALCRPPPQEEDDDEEEEKEEEEEDDDDDDASVAGAEPATADEAPRKSMEQVVQVSALEALRAIVKETLRPRKMERALRIEARPGVAGTSRVEVHLAGFEEAGYALERFHFVSEPRSSAAEATEEAVRQALAALATAKPPLAAEEAPTTPIDSLKLGQEMSGTVKGIASDRGKETETAKNIDKELAELSAHPRSELNELMMRYLGRTVQKADVELTGANPRGEPGQWSALLVLGDLDGRPGGGETFEVERAGSKREAERLVSELALRRLRELTGSASNEGTLGEASRGAHLALRAKTTQQWSGEEPAGEEEPVYRSSVKSYNAKEGFGFLAAVGHFGRDIFLHKAQAKGLRVGDRVSFTVELNDKGQPQARNVEKISHERDVNFAADTDTVELVQLFRVAVINALESHHAQRMMINEVGQDNAVKKIKAALPRALTAIKILNAFPDNFRLEHKGNGQFLVSLLSADAVDTSGIDMLVAEGRISWRGESQLNGDVNFAADTSISESVVVEQVQEFRVAVISALKAHHAQRMMLNELGQVNAVWKIKAALPGALNAIKILEAFPDNFRLEDKGNGQFLVSLLSADVVDTSGIDLLVADVEIFKFMEVGRLSARRALRADRKDTSISESVVVEMVQEFRVAVINTLEAHHAQRMMLNEVGQDTAVKKIKAALPRALTAIKVLKAFPDNFRLEDKGDGQFLVSLLSADVVDTSGIDMLVADGDVPVPSGEPGGFASVDSVAPGVPLNAWSQ